MIFELVGYAANVLTLDSHDFEQWLHNIQIEAAGMFQTTVYF